MLEGQILNLLKKISGQLDEIAKSQQVIREEIILLHEELVQFQENTLKSLESSIFNHPPESILN